MWQKKKQYRHSQKGQGKEGERTTPTFAIAIAMAMAIAVVIAVASEITILHSILLKTLAKQTIGNKNSNNIKEMRYKIRRYDMM